MIQAFVGLVGGGKSFCSTRRMMSYIALGGRVATNIRFVGYDEKSGDLLPDSPVISYLRSIGWEYQPRQYVYISYDEMCENPKWYEKIPAGFSRDRRTLCVVDEATDLFDTLDGGKLRTDSGYRGLFHFLRLSRHAHIDVLFICQDLNTINARLKNLVSNIWRSTDMRNFRIGIFKFGFPVDVFLLQLFDRSGKNLIQREYVSKDPRIFKCYESETFGGCLGVKWDGVAVADGKISHKKGNKKMTKTSWTLLISALLIAVFAAFKQPAPASSAPSVDLSFTNNLFRAVNDLALKIKGIEEKNSVGSVSIEKPVSSEADCPATNVYIRGEYRFHRAGIGNEWLHFNGARIRRGCPCEYGRVITIEEDYTLCIKDDGKYSFLLPQENGGVPPPPASL